MHLILFPYTCITASFMHYLILLLEEAEILPHLFIICMKTINVLRSTTVSNPV